MLNLSLSDSKVTPDTTAKDREANALLNLKREVMLVSGRLTSAHHYNSCVFFFQLGESKLWLKFSCCKQGRII